MSQILDGIPFHDMAEDHLNSLVLLRVAENARLEYKMELKTSSDKDKRELCKDVSALANSQGGYILFGISESNGTPSGIPGIQFDDTFKQQLFQILMSGISPRIQRLNERVVPLKNGYKVLVLKLEPDGYLHQVKYDDNRYYKRAGTITIAMESSDVETFFRSSGPSTRKEEVEDINDIYCAALKSKKYFKGVEGKGICALTVIPEVSSIKLDMSALPSNFNILFRPLYCSGWGSEITGRSRFTYGRGTDDKVPYAVTEVTDMGEVKAYNSFMLENRHWDMQLPEQCSGYIPSIAYERELVAAFHLYLTSLKELGVSGPFFCHVALLNIRGYVMYTDPMLMVSGGRIFQQDDIRPGLCHIPNEKGYATIKDMAKSLRPIFDFIWREFGYERSYNFSESGEWAPTR